MCVCVCVCVCDTLDGSLYQELCVYADIKDVFFRFAWLVSTAELVCVFVCLCVCLVDGEIYLVELSFPTGSSCRRPFCVRVCMCVCVCLSLEREEREGLVWR